MTRVRIADVAEAAHVSKATVSFAFNKPEEISASTRNRVLAIAHKLGYTPHPTARSLSTRRSGSIGFLIPQPIEVVFANPFVSALIRGIGEVCEQHDLTLLLVPPLNGSVESAISRAAVDGFISLGLNTGDRSLETLRRIGLPCILVDADPQPGVASVNIDDFGGAAAAAKHLLKLGHRRIAVVGLGQPRDRGETGIGARRLAGYRQTIRAAGCPAPRVVPEGVTFESGQAAFEQLWRGRSQPTAVLAMSDMAAIGLMASAREHGILMPQELSVVGFDDIPMATWVTPALTTVRQPIAEKGRQAARLLVSQLSGKRVKSPQPLATELVIRQSTAAPRR
jgi:alanine racemase